MLNEIEIFENLNRYRIFLANVDQIRDFRNFEPKSNFFSKMLTAIKIFEILNQNRNFSKMLTEIKIFEILNRKGNFSKSLTEIENFVI